MPQFDYYYGDEAEQYSFYRIPKVLFTDACFRCISVEAKVLYGLLLDRMALSLRNGWLDKQQRVYIIFTIADVMETLGCAQQKANRLLSELDTARGVGLIERVRRGLGRPNVIYVKNFIRRAGRESQIQNCENRKSGNAGITNPDLRRPQTNKTDLNKTDLSDTQSICQGGKLKTAGEDNGLYGPGGDKGDLMGMYREQIKDNIEFGILAEDSPFDRERLEGLVELMAEACACSRETIRINRWEMPAGEVRKRFLGLDSRHIRYVMESMDRSTPLVGNIRAYLLSALYNAPATISQYYASLVDYEMSRGQGRGG